MGKISRNRFSDVDMQTETDIRLFREGMRMDGCLPAEGDIILLNEIIKSPEQRAARVKGFRGCVRVERVGEVLIVCTVIRSCGFSHTTTFRKVDFLKGLLVFEKLEKPIYTAEYSYEELKIKNRA